ncbi:hypothetical protein HBHAL_2731 [Halobacillus halophilus DSM 2266]|uniref:Uncharacterized protein n=1 Tax=Halobacillus halophilus (strain ATCC 35676 / DSM 2266 / JCM 20832 / KCTC 3685 / LMG 17431 / NBRC 102448 / NCIMB 2269) TaxID=866895 RepID=I0JLR0_HALH3|nr:hypothetical protein HBHAL_2731 [Halobacillus halophilus DSM 2266]
MILVEHSPIKGAERNGEGSSIPARKTFQKIKKDDVSIGYSSFNFGCS